MTIDYSLYLITDSTEAILGAKQLNEIVRQAIEGGVTIVQYRDKISETAQLIRTGGELHRVCRESGIPLLINDRIDVALAIGAEGVHVGQDDMDLATARKLMGPDAIIGVTCSTIDEARRATIGGADYLGIGTIFATPTKKNTKSIIGTAGAQAILSSLSLMDQNVATVAIGGINASNVQRVMFQSKATLKGLDGVAVVSAIVAAEDSKQAALELRSLIATPPPTIINVTRRTKKVEELLEKVPRVVRELGQTVPLTHNMTNLVVQNFAANVALAIGASPIMANFGGEAEDFAKLKGALVINMGTVTPEGLANYLQAIKAYNAHDGPIIFDPVGAGATQIRRDAVEVLMSGGYFDVIKGNESEIKTILGEGTIQQKGVDSRNSDTPDTEKASMVKTLASRLQNVVLMTGAIDFLSDGDRTYAIKNGHVYLGRISGSGCTLGTTIAAFTAVEKEDKLLAALSGILVFEIAGEHAAQRSEVRGPGTFVPAFLDALSHIADQAQHGDSTWLTTAAKVEQVNI